MTLVPMSQPSDTELETAWRLSQRLAGTEFVPRSLRGKPEATMACILYGRELGFGPMQSLQSINVIDGKPTMAPELMRALILRAGHRLVVNGSDTACTIHGVRCDDGSEATVSFTLEDAVQARLCRIENGKAVSRSRDGKPLPWETYTKDMLVARATSRIARQLFPDVISGVSYTAEEIQSVADEAPPPLRVVDPVLERAEEGDAGPLGGDLDTDLDGGADGTGADDGTPIEATAVDTSSEPQVPPVTDDELAPPLALNDAGAGEEASGSQVLEGESSAPVVPPVPAAPPPETLASYKVQLAELIKALPPSQQLSCKGALTARFGPSAKMTKAQMPTAIAFVAGYPETATPEGGESGEPF